MTVIFVFVISICIVLFAELVPSLKKTTFDQIDVGENFRGDRKGFCKKVRSDYFILVNLGRTATLFNVPDEHVTTAQLSIGDENKKVEAHYIKGYFTEEFIVLCEERDDDSLAYVSFYFETEAIEHYDTEHEVYELFEFNSTQWVNLCNVNADILSKCKNK